MTNNKQSVKRAVRNDSVANNRELAEVTTPESVYQALRDEIVLGTLKPGKQLRINTVCDRYNARLTPARDALARLAAEGLVSQADRRGFVVSSVSNDEIRELVTTRCWLEELAFARSIAHRDRAWEERLRAAYDRMIRIPRSTRSDEYRINKEWEARHRAFHEALIANCDSRLLLGYCRELRDRSDRYRHLAAGEYSFPIDIVEGQHVAMMDYASEGRSDDALRTLREHFQITWSIVEQAITEVRPA